MNCWQTLGLSPEATESEVLGAHERLLSGIHDEVRREELDGARDEALRRINVSFESLFGALASSLPGNEEALWNELRHAQISGLERELPDNASERLKAVAWLVRLVQSPSDVLPLFPRPASIGSAVQRMALHALEPRLTTSALGAWAGSPYFDVAALTPALVHRMDDAAWSSVFSSWGDEHPLLRGPAAQAIAIRRLRLGKSRAWVGFLNCNFANDDLSDVEVLHMDFITCVAAGKSGMKATEATRLLLWMESVVALWHDEDRTPPPPGPETGFLSTETVDYLFALLARLIRVEDRGAVKRLQAKSGRLFMDHATLRLDVFRPFRHPVFLAWLLAGAALSFLAELWTVREGLAAIAGYALTTSLLLKWHFFMGPPVPSVRWTLAQLERLEKEWGYSSSHLWALLERIRDDNPVPLRRLKAAFLVRAFARPQVLSTWIGNHLTRLPLRGGPIEEGN